MSRLVIQVGWRRNRKDGQLINAWVEGDVVDWKSFPGYWLTPQQSEKTRYMMWHLCDLDVEEGANIKISVKTGIRNQGKDEARTVDMFFRMGSEADEIVEIRIPGVGFRHYPILKGRVIELKSESTEQTREKGAGDFLTDGF